MLNGVFQFKIDGVAQEGLVTGVRFSDEWFPAEFAVPRGTHDLVWVYKKFNQYGVTDDLSAEIDFVQIRGVKSMNKECQVCTRGKPNAD